MARVSNNNTTLRLHLTARISLKYLFDFGPQVLDFLSQERLLRIGLCNDCLLLGFQVLCLLLQTPGSVRTQSACSSTLHAPAGVHARRAAARPDLLIILHGGKACGGPQRRHLPPQLDDLLRQ